MRAWFASAASRYGWSAPAILALLCALSWPMQGPTLGENSNYALVKALATGTATIDRTRYEVGELTAGDFRTLHGHVYSDKAPGLAFFTLPAYLALRALGLRVTGDPTEALWALRLWGAVLPAALLLFLVRKLADEVAEGTGTATAFALGAGTLVMPFATLFYSHVLTPFLLFAAFALLWWERGGPSSAWRLAAAGFLSGFAFTSEYPCAIAAFVYGLYAVSRAPRLRRGAVYAAGVFAGVLPLLLYNRWAFGSMTHLSYFGDELSGGNLAGRLDPSLVNVLFTFLSMPGLLVLSPVLGAGIVGTAYMYLDGKRAEALVIASVVTLFTIYSASLPGVEYDAWPYGPRYLLPTLPLLALPLATMFRRWPQTTWSLSVISVILMATLTATRIHTGVRDAWFEPALDRRFPQTAATVVGITGWYAIVPFFFAVAVAGAAAALASRRASPAPDDPLVAGLAVVSWAALASFAPNTIDGRAATLSAYLPALCVLLLLAAVLWGARTAGTPATLRAR